jgi:hypothetical protein
MDPSSSVGGHAVTWRDTSDLTIKDTTPGGIPSSGEADWQEPRRVSGGQQVQAGPC